MAADPQRPAEACKEKLPDWQGCTAHTSRALAEYDYDHVPQDGPYGLEKGDVVELEEDSAVETPN